MKSIYLVDGGFFTKKFKAYSGKFPISKDIKKIINKINDKYNDNNEYVRIYYYDCPPLDRKIYTPIKNTLVDLKTTTRFKENFKLLNDLKREDLVAVREGFLSFDGWTLKKNVIKQLKKNNTIIDENLGPKINQKGVDIKIGLDIAWISLSKVANRIILITGDGDFIPAMKFARRNGIQVVLCTFEHGVIGELKDHSDILITANINEIINN